MSKLKTLVKLLLFINTVGAETINCTQCAGGNFIKKRRLFDSRTMEYDWRGAWWNTDCHNGNYIIRECEYACLTIVIEKDFKQKRGYEYDGIMMDCSESLIYKTTDLAAGIDYRFYNKEATYSVIRADHNITYFFSTESVVGTDGILKLPIKSMPEQFADKYFIFNLHFRSLFFYVPFAIVIVIFLSYLSWFCIAVLIIRCCGAYLTRRRKWVFRNIDTMILMTEMGVRASEKEKTSDMDSIHSGQEIEPENGNEMDVITIGSDITFYSIMEIEPDCENKTEITDERELLEEVTASEIGPDDALLENCNVIEDDSNDTVLEKVLVHENEYESNRSINLVPEIEPESEEENLDDVVIENKSESNRSISSFLVFESENENENETTEELLEKKEDEDVTELENESAGALPEMNEVVIAGEDDDEKKEDAQV